MFIATQWERTQIILDIWVVLGVVVIAQALAGGLAGRDRDPQVKGYVQLHFAIRKSYRFSLFVPT
jgi:hypothetical protein